jgi:hypothetical protein
LRAFNFLYLGSDKSPFFYDGGRGELGAKRYDISPHAVLRDVGEFKRRGGEEGAMLTPFFLRPKITSKDRDDSKRGGRGR